MEVSTYNSCLLIISISSECFGIMEIQINNTFGLSNDAFAIKEFQKLVFTAKKKQFLTPNNPLFFNKCVLTVNKDTLRIRQKKQGQKLEKATDAILYVQQRARKAYIATICQPKASFNLSAAAQIINPSKKDIAKLNKRTEWQQKHLNLGLNYVPIELNIMKLYAIINASFANNPDLSSKIGYVIVLENEKTTEKSFEFTSNIIH
jgi:hypothetical protein